MNPRRWLCALLTLGGGDAAYARTNVCEPEADGVSDESATPWPKDAAELDREGQRLFDAGDFAGAYAAQARAYGSLVDVRLHLTARDEVLGAMRGAQLKLYEQTGELMHLCVARADQLRHLEALVREFGEDSELPDIGGTRWRLEQLSEKIARHPPRLGEPDCDGIVPRVDRPAPPRPDRGPRPPAPPPQPRLVIVLGATSVSVGGLLLGAMTYALLEQRGAAADIAALDGEVAMQPGGRPTRGQRERAETLWAVGHDYRTVAIVTGVTGGAFALAGVITLALRPVLRDRKRRLSLHPSPSPSGAGLLLIGNF